MNNHVSYRAFCRATADIRAIYKKVLENILHIVDVYMPKTIHYCFLSVTLKYCYLWNIQNYVSFMLVIMVILGLLLYFLFSVILITRAYTKALFTWYIPPHSFQTCVIFLDILTHSGRITSTSGLILNFA